MRGGEGGWKRSERYADVGASMGLPGAVVDLYETRRNEPQPPPLPGSDRHRAAIHHRPLRLVCRKRRVAALRELPPESAIWRGHEDVISPKKRAPTRSMPPTTSLCWSHASKHEMKARRPSGASIGASLAMDGAPKAPLANLLLCSLPVRPRTVTTTDWARTSANDRRGGDATPVYHPTNRRTRRAIGRA